MSSKSRTNELIINSSPFLRMFPKTVFLYEKVQKHTKTRNVYEDRTLVVSLSGIYILKQRKLQKSYQVSHHMSILELSLITVVSESVKFTSQKDHITIREPNDYLLIAATVYSLHSTLFAHQNLKVSIDIDEGIRDSFEKIYVPVQFESNLACRFIACASFFMKETKEIVRNVSDQVNTCQSSLIFLGFTSFDEDLFYITYEMMNQIDNTIEFTEKAKNNEFLPAIVMAVAFGQEVMKIEFKNDTFNKAFEKAFMKILKISTTIQTITFSDVIFDHKVDLAFDSSVLCPVNEFTFNRCVFVGKQSFIFNENVNNYPSMIKKLHFLKCKFVDYYENTFNCSNNNNNENNYNNNNGIQNKSGCEDTFAINENEALDSVFQALFFANCFHNLEEIVIDDVFTRDNLLMNYLCQLATCTWALSSKCLRNFSATNCGLNLELLLPMITTVDTGIVNLALNGNIFNGCLKKRISNFQSVVNLDLSCCVFIDKSLISLFESLATTTTTAVDVVTANYNSDSSTDQSAADNQHLMLMRLNLAKLKISSSNWTNFYMDINKMIRKKYIFSKISTLIWDGNMLDDKNGSTFVQMVIKMMPNLKELSINDSIKSKQFSENVNELIEIKYNLKSLSLQNSDFDPNISIGDLINWSKLFENNKELENLDITNQNIDDENIMKIFQSLNFALKDFRYSGFTCKEIKNIITIIEMTLKSTLKFCVWPHKDIKKALMNTEIRKRMEFKNQFDVLKGKFMEKFGKDSVKINEKAKIKPKNRNKIFDDKSLYNDGNSVNPKTMITTSNINSNANPIVRDNYDNYDSSLSYPKEINLEKIDQTTIIDNMEFLKHFSEYDEETLVLIKECGNVLGRDPIMLNLGKLCKHSEIPYLMNGLSKMFKNE